MADAVENGFSGPIHTLLVIDDDVIHRMGGIIRHLCVGMIDEAVRVTILSRSSDRAMIEGIGPTPAVVAPHRRRFWSISTADSILEAIGGQSPDLVHCLSADLAAWYYGWGASWRCPLVVQLTDPDDLRGFSDLAVEPLVNGIAIASRLRTMLLERAPHLGALVQVIPFGLPAEAEASCMRTANAMPTAVVTVPLIRYSGLEVVFKALKIVVKAGQEMQLFILSGGKSEDRWRAMVGDLGLRSFVTFAGPLTDWTAMRKAMLAADFHVIPDIGGRFVATSLIALAGGLATLAPEGTIEDYLINGQTACLFEAGYHKDLARKWLALLQDRDATRRLGESALQYARACHQASGMVSETAAMYRRLCTT